MARGSKPGERRGGRKKGIKNRSTIAQGLSLSVIAQGHTKEAIEALVDICVNGESEAARVSASVALLDRGYGKPTQQLEVGGAGGGPIMIHFDNIDAAA